MLEPAAALLQWGVFEERVGNAVFADRNAAAGRTSTVMGEYWPATAPI